MKSLYARIEALEKQAIQNLILAVPMADGTERKMNVKEFLTCAPDKLADPVRDRESKLAIGTPPTNQQIHTDRPPLNCRD